MVTMHDSIESELISRAVPFRRDVPLRQCSTWRIGGPADFLVEPQTIEHVRDVVRITRRRRMPLVVVGKGSNLLFGDDGVRGVVLRMGSPMSQIHIDGPKVVAGGGVFTPRLARRTGSAGLSGLEHAVGIPGTLGGLIAMNGGSQQQAVGDVVDWVRFVDDQGRIGSLRGEQCCFVYRHSIFLERSAVVVEAGLTLTPAAAATVLRKMIGTLRVRRQRYPLDLPNCGSVFLSSPSFYEQFGAPGAFMDALGLKGHAVGDAAVSERHANFIVNRGAARAGDVIELIEFIRDTVRRRTDMTLHSEVRLVRPDGTITPC